MFLLFVYIAYIDGNDDRMVTFCNQQREFEQEKQRFKEYERNVLQKEKDLEDAKIRFENDMKNREEMIKMKERKAIMRCRRRNDWQKESVILHCYKL